MIPEALLVGAVAGAFVALVVVLLRRAARADRTGGGGGTPERSARTVLALDLRAGAGDLDAGRRLAAEAAAPLFRDDTSLAEVEVRDRDGTLLAIVDRAHGLELADRDPFAMDTPGQQLHLPATVRDRLPDDPSLVDLVAGILRASGYDVAVEGDIVRAGDRAVVALEATDPDALSAAFLRYRDSGARTGVAVGLRSVPPAEARRRELLAPDLRYAGPQALQRMADAVAVGGDPLVFALGPPPAPDG